MDLDTIIEPEFEPVSLQDVYTHLRLDPIGSPPEHPDDVALTRNIKTARREVERLSGRSLVRQKLRLSAPDFNRLMLWRPPLISVAAVRYYDSPTTLQTLAGDSWYVTADRVPQLRLVSGACPGLYCRTDAVQVDYWTGYPVSGSPGTTREEQIANVPSEAVDAILLGVQLLYDEMTPDKRAALERARESLIGHPPFKIHVLR
jgi:uncharacterized phiE125 gp8 family phage protein